MHTELLHIATTIKDIGAATQVIVQKEKEKRHLEAQLRYLEKQQKTPKSEPFQPLFPQIPHTQPSGMAELWPSASRRILPRSFKPQPLSVPHGSPFVPPVRHPFQGPQVCPTPTLKPSTTMAPPDPTVGASSTQPEDFFPMIPKN